LKTCEGEVTLTVDSEKKKFVVKASDDSRITVTNPDSNNKPIVVANLDTSEVKGEMTEKKEITRVFKFEEQKEDTNDVASGTEAHTEDTETQEADTKETQADDSHSEVHEPADADGAKSVS